MALPARVENEGMSQRVAADWKGAFDTAAEVDCAVDQIEGELPRGLVGTLYRNGPGGNRFARSFFDGDGLIRALRITADGNVRYQSRFVATEKYLAERGGDRPRRRMAGTNLPGGPLRNLFRPPAHEANTNVVPHAGRLLALEEGGHPYEIDPETLRTGAMSDFAGALPRLTAFSAHPHVDPDSGDLYNFGIAFGAKPRLQVFRVAGDNRMHRIGDVPLINTFFVHDYALSKRWMCFFMAPLAADIGRFLLGLDSFFGSLRWKPQLGGTFALLPRAGGAPLLIDTEPFVLGHVLGAWDEGDEIIVDCTRQDDWGGVAEATANFRTSDYECFGTGSVWRYRIDSARLRVSGEELCPLPAEFPRIDARRECSPGRWGYFAANTRRGEGGMYRATLKLDRHNGNSELHDFGTHSAAHEPVFAPRPGARDEDDGWLLTFVHDSRRGATDVAILDARRVADGPLCTLHLPINAGMTFHGNWVGEQ